MASGVRDPERDRAQRWTLRSTGELQRLFPGATFEQLQPGPFEARVVRRTMPRTLIEGISADPYLVRRSPADVEHTPRAGLHLNVVLEGHGEVTRGDTHFDIQGGQVFLLRPDEPFSYRCTVWTRTFRATVAEDLLPLEMRNSYEPPFAVLETTPVVRAFVRVAADLLADDATFEPTRTSTPHLEAALVALEQGVLAEDLAARPSVATGNDVLRKEVLDFIELHLRDRDLAPGMIAERFSVSVRTVHNLFKSLPETPAGRVRRRRVEEAATILRLRDATNAELGELLGFSSGDTFLRAFQRQQGVAPREYRALQELIARRPPTTIEGPPV